MSKLLEQLSRPAGDRPRRAGRACCCRSPNWPARSRASHELDINPLLADEHGVIALDARVVLGDGPLAPDATYSHLAIHPYPKSAGARIAPARPARPCCCGRSGPRTLEAERRFISRLSPKTMYLRFHAPLRELTMERLVRYTQIDYDREMAFVAIDANADHPDGEIRGIARYTRNPDGITCEFGVVDRGCLAGPRPRPRADERRWRSCARERGISEIIGYVLSDNDDMGKLMRARMYDARRDEDEAGVLRFGKPLQAAALGSGKSGGAKHSGAAGEGLTVRACRPRIEPAARACGVHPTRCRSRARFGAAPCGPARTAAHG
ncbi:MAG: acetate--CoA ligase family protein [Comamonadaceae bacterium]|nr:acetate--CoA ligase family protein [Comamonadaceae bacterium]